MTERNWTKLRVTSDRLNGAHRGDIIELDDSVAVEYLIASGQCELVQDEPKPEPVVVTKVKQAATKVGRRKRKE